MRAVIARTPQRRICASLLCITTMAQERVCWLIDDDPAFHGLVSRALVEVGLATVSFYEAEALLSRLDDQIADPELIVADVMMPGMSGFAMVRALRMRPALARIPIIIATARAEVGDAVLAAKLNATLMRKPFRIRDFIVTAERLIEFSQPIAVYRP